MNRIWSTYFRTTFSDGNRCLSNRALAGDPRALATIIQIGGQLDVFTSQPEARIDTSAYDILMRKLEEMGYDTGRRHQPALHHAPSWPPSNEQRDRAVQKPAGKDEGTKICRRGKSDGGSL